jgi:hypothetical protein
MVVQYDKQDNQGQKWIAYQLGQQQITEKKFKHEFPPLWLCLCKLPARIRAVWQGNYTISSFFKAMALLCSVNGTIIDSP